MKLNVMFTIAAFYGFIFGLATLFFTPQMAAMGGVPASAAVFFVERVAGVAALGLGLIAWLVRNSDASKARDGVTLGFTIYFALGALLSLMNQFTDAAQPVGWVGAIIQALFAVGFFMAGKASMSETAK